MTKKTMKVSIDMTMVSVDSIESLLNALNDGKGYTCDCMEDLIIYGKIMELNLYNEEGRYLDMSNCLEWICSEDEYNCLMSGCSEDDEYEDIMKGLQERGIVEDYDENGTFTLNNDIVINRMATFINEEIWNMVE